MTLVKRTEEALVVAERKGTVTKDGKQLLVVAKWTK